MQRSPTSKGRHYLVQLTSNDGSWHDVTELTSRVRSAVTRARRDGTEVAFVRSVYAPESNALFLVYQATTEEAVFAAAHGAGLWPASVSAAIEAVDGGAPMR